jgi:hypothetical protein
VITRGHPIKGGIVRVDRRARCQHIESSCGLVPQHEIFGASMRLINRELFSRSGDSKEEGKGMKTLAVTALGIAMCASLVYAQEKSYWVSSSSEIVRKLPCEAFSKNSDDSWTLVATVVIDGKSSSGNTFRHSPDSRILDQRCSGEPKTFPTQKP